MTYCMLFLSSSTFHCLCLLFIFIIYFSFYISTIHHHGLLFIAHCNKTWKNLQKMAFLKKKLYFLQFFLIYSGTVHCRELGSIVSVLGQDEGCRVKYNPLPSEFPRAKPEGTPEGKGWYLTVYPESSRNTDIISF